VHRAQKTPTFKEAARNKKVQLVMIPPGCTEFAQPLDVGINAQFKRLLDDEASKFRSARLEDYVKGTISVGERRILMTKWVSIAWKKVCTITVHGL